jgi:hypothetical protein
MSTENPIPNPYEEQEAFTSILNPTLSEHIVKNYLKGPDIVASTYLLTPLHKQVIYL